MSTRALASSLAASVVVACGSSSSAPAPDGGVTSASQPVEEDRGSVALRVAAELARGHTALDEAFTAGNGLQPDGDQFGSPGDREAKNGAFEHLAARFPRVADQPFEVDVARVARLRVRLTPLGARPTQGKVIGGRVAYPDAFAATDLVALGNAFYAEHLLVLRDPTATPSITYRLEVGKGLHLRRDADGTLALLDATDDPRLRILRPYAVDARGVRRDATMTLDHDLLHIELDPTGLTHPILLDPAIESFLWENKAPATSPSARGFGAMSYDSARKVMVMYGGDTKLGSGTPQADTWEYNGTTWTQRCGAPLAACGTMPALNQHGMAYHAASSRTFLHGWVFGSGNVSYLGTWNGTAWTVSSWGYPAPAGYPMPRFNQGTAYDSTRGVVIEQGGNTLGGMADTLLWNGSTWSSPTGAPATSVDCAVTPWCRYYHRMVYHAATDRVVLFAGSGASSADTWAYDPGAKTWASLSPSVNPSLRYAYGFAYDARRKRSVLFGGNGPLDDTWEWTGTNWTPITPLTKPSARGYFSMAYDADRGRVVAFGGQGSGVMLGDTWEYHSRGASCTTSAECDTGACVDNVCCESSACGTCQQCNGTSPGTCTAVISVADPDTCAAPAATCNGAGVCKKLQGQACVTGTDCLSSYCVDSVCCGTACGENCYACKATLKASGADDGTCGPAKDGLNPHGNCTAGTGGECGQTGTCDGGGKCRLQASGKGCGTGAVCTGTVAKGQACDGAGSCLTLATGTDCAPGVCVSGTGCKTTCTVDTDCASTAYCDTSVGQCKTKKTGGGACSKASECGTGFCVDSVCCNSLCNEKCQACAAAVKQSGTGDGVCGAAKDGANPHADCTKGKGGVCGETGACDGAGACKLEATGAACGAGVCEGNTFKGQQCDGLGVCISKASGTDCAPAKCTAAKGCGTACAVDAECDSSGFCDKSVTPSICKSKKKNGEVCATASECENPFCVDGVCCNKPCGGDCEQCNSTGAVGTCVPVSGDPKARCAAAKAGEPCTGRRCDGVTGTTCEGFVDSKVVCREAACTDGKSVTEARCDATGKCPADAAKPCEPYACDAKVCKIACSADTDCASPATCDKASGKCVNAAKCDGDRTLTSADGKTKTDCTPYRCDASGRCKDKCVASSEDCAAPALCLDGRCVQDTAPVTDDSGGCALGFTGRRPQLERRGLGAGARRARPPSPSLRWVRRSSA